MDGLPNKLLCSLACLVPLLFSAMVQANDRSPPGSDSAEGVVDATFEMVHQFSDCVGFWTAFSSIERSMDQPAAAEESDQIANGADLSAVYLLVSLHQMQNPDGPGPDMTALRAYVGGRAEAARATYLARVERDGFGSLVEPMQSCNAMRPVAQSIIDRLGAESIGIQRD
ncbi:MAG: hypothetical protein ACXIUZ_14975 [Lysobacteraceae bacterium]